MHDIKLQNVLEVYTVINWGHLLHVSTRRVLEPSGVAKPRPTRAWARASASGTSYFCSTAVCNDAVSYALLTSLFARLPFNTGENLYCAHACRSHGSELLPTQDRRHFKNSLKNHLSSYLKDAKIY